MLPSQISQMILLEIRASPCVSREMYMELAFKASSQIDRLSQPHDFGSIRDTAAREQIPLPYRLPT
jgi:hypothetical protein